MDQAKSPTMTVPAGFQLAATLRMMDPPPPLESTTLESQRPLIQIPVGVEIEDNANQLKLIMQKKVVETQRLKDAHEAEIKKLKLQLESNIAALDKNIEEQLSALPDPETLFVWMAKYTSPKEQYYVQLFLSQIEAYKRKKERADIMYWVTPWVSMKFSFISVDFLSHKDIPQEHLMWIDDGAHHRLDD